MTVTTEDLKAAIEAKVGPISMEPTYPLGQEPYESPKHFACVFTSELEENKPAKLRPVRKTKATIGAMEKAILSGLVTRDTATIKQGSEGANAIAVYVVKSAELEKELAPYRVVG